jgi:hypothetical protein
LIASGKSSPAPPKHRKPQNAPPALTPRLKNFDGSIIVGKPRHARRHAAIRSEKVLRLRFSCARERSATEVLEGKNNGKREIRPNWHPRLMLYIAIQCRGTPFRDKVWSHKANSGRLEADLWGAPRRQIHLWARLRPEGRHNEKQLRVKNVGCDEDVAVESAEL